jgi:hypothetical protein
MNLFGDIPRPEDIIGTGRQKVVDVIGNKGLVLRKGVGTLRRIYETFSPIGTKSRTELAWNVQRDFMWDFVLRDIKDSKGQILKGTEVGKFCQSVRIEPYKLADVVTLNYGAEKRSYPGQLIIDNITATFICGVPNYVGHYFQSWFDLMVKDGVYYPKKNFVKDADVILYDRKSSKNEHLVLMGLFPISHATYDLSYEGNSYLKYNVTLNVDRIEFKEIDNQGDPVEKGE